MPGVFNDQAMFDAKVAELEEQRLNPDPAPAVEEEVVQEPEPAPEPELCPDFTYNVCHLGDCQRQELTKLCLRCDHFPRQDLEGADVMASTISCNRFFENYGGYSHGSCYEADKPYCPNCTDYPRDKWLYSRAVSEWTDDEVAQFLEVFNIHVKMGTGRWELNNAVEDILNVVKAVAQIATAKKDEP